MGFFSVIIHRRRCNTKYHAAAGAATPMVLLVVLLLITVLLASGPLLVSARNCDWELYKLLGVQRDASPEEIRRGYKRAAIKHDPIRNANKENPSKVDFAAINNAYSTLMDKKLRALYDKHCVHGAEAEQLSRQGNAASRHPLAQFFGFGDHQFGGGGRGSGHDDSDRPKRKPIVVPLEVTLAELYTGARIRATVRRPRTCDTCHGTGAHDPNAVTECPSCGGRGIIIEHREIGPNMIAQMQRECNVCKGKGSVIKHKCHVCKGTKVTRETEEIVVHVDRGMSFGDKITIEDAGDESPSYHAADLVFELAKPRHIAESSIYHLTDGVFVRDNSNLHTMVSLSLSEALFGFSRTIKHLDGRAVEIKRSDVTTQPGQIIIVPKEGMPLPDSFDETYGDLYIHYNVTLPTPTREHHKKVLAAILQDISEAENMSKR